MNIVFERLEIYNPKTEVGKQKKLCEFKTAISVIDCSEIACLIECVSFSANDIETQVEEYCKQHNRVCIKIVLKCGFVVSNVLVSKEFLKSFYNEKNGVS